MRCNTFSHFGWSTRKKDKRRGSECHARKERRPRLTKQNELGSYLISAAALARVETGGRRRNEIPMCSSKKVCGGGERWKRRRNESLKKDRMNEKMAGKGVKHVTVP